MTRTAITFLNYLKHLLRFTFALRAMTAVIFVVFVSKLLTISNLFSAPSKDPLATAKELMAELPKIENIQLDNQGLTLQIDFMNLTPNDLKVLESLFNYREKLKQKGYEVQKKEDQLTIVEERIKQQLVDLKRIQEEITSLINRHTEQEEKKLTLLVKIYENMKADQAAQIFTSLPEERVLVLLQRMREVKSAAILANMNPLQASYLTDRILGQKELKP